MRHCVNCKTKKIFFAAGLFMASIFVSLPVTQRQVMADEREGLEYVDGMWCYMDNGTVDTMYTGVCESDELGLVYVRNGLLDFSYSGIAMYNNRMFCFQNGTFLGDYTGLWLDSTSGMWYVRYGVVDTNMNGFVQQDDKWWAVKDGKAADYYTGLWFDSEQGWCFVRNGVIDSGYSGIVTFGENKWCIFNGRLRKDYTGIWHDDKLGDCFIKNGILDSDYSGSALRYIEGYNDQLDYETIVNNICYVENGVINESYCGLVSYNGIKAYLKTGRFDNTFTGKVYDSASKTYVFVKYGVPVNWGEYIYQDILAAKSNNPEYTYEENGVNIYIKHDSYDGRTYWLAKVFVEDPDKVGVTMANGGMGNGRQTTSSFAQSVGAIFAVNASGFDWNTSLPQGGAPVVENGKVLRSGQVANMGAYTYHGEFLTPTDWMYDDQMMQTFDIKGTFIFGPTLIRNGQIEDIPTDAYKSTVYYGRSIVGQVKPGYYVFLVTDRSSTAAGLTLFEARDIMAANGCTYAYNLDAGGSASMVFDGKLINAPADGTERAVIQFIHVSR